MLTRRDLLKTVGLLSLAPGCATVARDRRERVNDIHSELNPTWVTAVERPRTLEELQSLISETRRRGGSISICGRPTGGVGSNVVHPFSGSQASTQACAFDWRTM